MFSNWLQNKSVTTTFHTQTTFFCRAVSSSAGSWFLPCLNYIQCTRGWWKRNWKTWLQQRWVQAKQARVVRIVKKVTTAGCWSSSRPVTLWFFNLDFLYFALQCRCALMCCPMISMPANAMEQLIQFIHDIPFREINVLKTKSCFEMVSSISLFGSTFTIFILFRTNTKTTTETEERQLIQCNGQCTKPIGWVRALVAFKRFFLSMG